MSSFIAWLKKHTINDASVDMKFRRLDNGVIAAFHADGTPANKAGAIAQQTKDNDGNNKQINITAIKSAAELLKENGGDVRQAVKAFCKSIQGRCVMRSGGNFGEHEVYFTKDGLRKMA